MNDPSRPASSDDRRGWQQQGYPQQGWSQQQYPGQQQYPTGPAGPPPWAGQPNGGQQPPPKKRMGWGARIGAAVVGLWLFGACLNAADPDEPQASSSVAESTPAVPEQTAAPVEAAPPAFPGAQPEDVSGPPDSLLVAGDAALTASALTEGSATFSRTLCTAVSYRNDSDDTLRYNTFDWSMQNPSGAIVSPTFFGGPDQALGSGELAPAGTVQGEVCFDDENASEGDYLLIYETPSFFTSARGVWINPR